jgi:hypothetical protein
MTTDQDTPTATPAPDPANESVVDLPYGRSVNVHAFSSAGRLQQITLRPEQSPPIEFIGNGANDKPIGQQVIATPATGPKPGYEVLVHIQSTDGVTWRPSAVVVARVIHAMAYNLILVASEDKVDANWSDATLMFTWSEPIVPS